VATVAVPNPGFRRKLTVLWVEIYLACLGLAFLVGLWIFLMRSERSVLDRWMAASFPFLVLIVASSIVKVFLEAPNRKWNPIRIAPPISLWHGYTLYYPPDSGPVTGNIYAPFSSIAYLPAALAPTPTGVVALGTLFSLLYYFAPALWLYLRGKNIPDDRSTVLAQWYTFILFPLVTFNRMKSLGYSAGFIHADAPALGLAGAACAVLYAAPPYRWNTLFLSALLAVLSVWSKQVMAPLLVAIPLWLLLTDGFKACFRYGLALLLAGGLAAAVFLTLFDARALWFNVVTIPGHHPWRSDFNLMTAALEFQELSFLMMLLLAFGALFSLALRSAPVVGLSHWLARNRWSLFAVASLLVLPTSLIGRVKIGGDPNALSFALYLLLLSVCLMLREGVAAPGVEALKTGMRVLAVVSIAGTGILLIQEQCERYLNLAQPQPNDLEVVHRYLQNHPGEAYFPWNPLGHLLVDGRYYHFDYGLYDRELAGFPLSEEHVRQHVPPGMRRVCFPPDRNFEHVLKYLKEYSRRVEIEELPGFICYERESQP
jgi:hypothetical protein